MEQYAVIGNHPPDNCPMANKAVREFAKKTYAKLPKLSKQYNVKILMDIHLDPGHKSLMIFEAPNAEAVRDLLVMAGFPYFLDLEFYLVTPIDQLLKHVEDMPTLY